MPRLDPELGTVYQAEYSQPPYGLTPKTGEPACGGQAGYLDPERGLATWPPDGGLGRPPCTAICTGHALGWRGCLGTPAAAEHGID